MDIINYLSNIWAIYNFHMTGYLDVTHCSKTSDQHVLDNILLIFLHLIGNWWSHAMRDSSLSSRMWYSTVGQYILTHYNHVSNHCCTFELSCDSTNHCSTGDRTLRPIHNRYISKCSQQMTNRRATTRANTNPQ